jgi:chemotaxis protein MotB
MNPKYFQPETGHRDRWMVSYLDVVTILLIFFVAAAAGMLHAHTPPPKPALAAPPAPVPMLIDARKSEPDKIEQDLVDSGLSVQRESRGLVVTLSQTVLFPSGGDTIGADALPAVEKIADVLRGIPNHVILTGHADSVPIHNWRFKNNWELSAARGLRLLELLHDRYGIEETRMSVSSDGANQPAKSNETPDGRANNRRVEIVIVDEPPAKP